MILFLLGMLAGSILIAGAEYWWLRSQIMEAGERS